MSALLACTTATVMPLVKMLLGVLSATAMMVSLAMAHFAQVCYIYTSSTPHYKHFHLSDINECEEDDSMCDSNAYCVNTIGSHECYCAVGFTGNGSTCGGI